MEFQEPYKVYTAATNLEAHEIVNLLEANGIPAHAMEDQSGVSLFALGTLPQYHQPNVWVDKSTAPQAAEVIERFEQERLERNPSENSAPLEATCEECEQVSQFSSNMNGTTQICPHCGAYMDVGDMEWDDDVGESEDDSAPQP